jgi:hypothetical protein
MMIRGVAPVPSIFYVTREHFASKFQRKIVVEIFQTEGKNEMVKTT